MEEGMSWEMWKIALMHYAGRTSENGVFSQGNIATRLRFWGVRKGSPPVGPDVTLLASLTSGQVLLGSFLQERAEWTNPFQLFPPTHRYSFNEASLGWAWRQGWGSQSLRQNKLWLSPTSLLGEQTHSAQPKGSFSWLLDNDPVGFHSSGTCFLAQETIPNSFLFPSCESFHSESQRQPSVPWTRGQTKGIKKSIYVLSILFLGWLQYQGLREIGRSQPSTMVTALLGRKTSYSTHGQSPTLRHGTSPSQDFLLS